MTLPGDLSESVDTNHTMYECTLHNAKCYIVKLNSFQLMSYRDLSNSESLLLHWFDTYWYEISGKPEDCRCVDLSFCGQIQRL